MPNSESTAKLYAALTRAQSKFTKLIKDKAGREGNIPFKYSQLPDVLNMVRPLLNAEGIFLSQPVIRGEDGFLRLTTKLVLDSEWVQTDGIPIPAMTPGKAMGLTLTYSRRIDLMPFLGISGEDDDEDAPDLKPLDKTNIQTVFENRAKLDAIKQSISRLNPEITDDDIPHFDTTPTGIPPLPPDLAAIADQLGFTPLSKDRNTEIQNRLKALVDGKTVDRRKLSLYLDAQHGGKKAFDVSAQQWEETMTKIELAVANGADAVKTLMKGEK